MSAQLELFDLSVDPDRGGGMAVRPWRGLQAWLEEIDRQLDLMRPSNPLYGRFDATAGLLTVERLRSSRDVAALLDAARRLSAARFATGHHFHDLNRVWTRAELGTLLVEARNRGRLLAMGRAVPKTKGPRLDPGRLPDDRLDVLIQSHRDMFLVETLRAERARRAADAPAAKQAGREEGRARADERACTGEGPPAALGDASP